MKRTAEKLPSAASNASSSSRRIGNTTPAPTPCFLAYDNFSAVLGVPKFKAAMFDFDGTVTEKGQYTPPKELADALVALSQKIPIAFCTGRQLESFERRGLSELLKEIEPGYVKQFLKNLHLFAENGAIGYDFDLELNDFRELYKIDWPGDFIDKEDLKRRLNEAIKDYGDVYEDAHRVVIVMRTNLHNRDERNIEEVYDLSEKIYGVAIELLESISSDFEQFLHVGNSGIGVVVGPANGDKDEGIKRFGEFLTNDSGIIFEPNFRDIMAVGDNPQYGGNDHYFLSGRYGTPYNVGESEMENKKL